MDPMAPGFHFGFGELKAVMLACGIIGGWAFLRYVARRNGEGDRRGEHEVGSGQAEIPQ